MVLFVHRRPPPPVVNELHIGSHWQAKNSFGRIHPSRPSKIVRVNPLNNTSGKSKPQKAALDRARVHGPSCTSKACQSEWHAFCPMLLPDAARQVVHLRLAAMSENEHHVLCGKTVRVVRCGCDFQRVGGARRWVVTVVSRRPRSKFARDKKRNPPSKSVSSKTTLISPIRLGPLKTKTRKKNIINGARKLVTDNFRTAASLLRLLQQKTDVQARVVTTKSALGSSLMQRISWMETPFFSARSPTRWTIPSLSLQEKNAKRRKTVRARCFRFVSFRSVSKLQKADAETNQTLKENADHVSLTVLAGEKRSKSNNCLRFTAR